MQQDQPTFKVVATEATDNYARLSVEPLAQGFGQTLGNSLRRVLLEHIPGAAITTVQINGVNHQFTTLEGMREDIVELILNIKQVRLSYTGDEPVTATLKATGPGDVLAGDLDLPAGVELANPELLLSHLADKKSKLEMTLTVESGQGYSPAEDRLVNTLGVIPIDAIFSPVIKVNFSVSDTRVGRFTNYDKLVMDVWTDGSMQPEAVLKHAASLLELYFRQIVNPIVETVLETETSTEQEPEVYKITVEELELPTRIANALRKAGLGTVKDLINADKEEIAKIKNLGSKSVDIVDAALKAKGVETTRE